MTKIIEILIEGFYFFGCTIIGLVLLYLIFRLISYAAAKSWIQVTKDQQIKQNGGENHGEEEE